MGKNYGMIYLKSTNVHLVKDMGMIPYKLHKNFGYNSTLITFKNGEYTYQDDVVKGLKLDFVKKRFNSYTIDGSVYLLKNSKKYDILQMFHVTLSSVCYSYIYKFINRKGKLYLKLDCSEKLGERIRGLSKFKRRLLSIFFRKYNIISVEQEKIYHELTELIPSLKDNLIVIPNGVDFKLLEDFDLEYSYKQKENIILNIARIGSEEKNTPMLLNAFKKVPDEVKKNWKLRLVGPIEDGFLEEYDRFTNENPSLKDKIELVGNIEDRAKLYKEYKRAKIFSLTSEFESFGIAFIEAGVFGDVIISTDVGIAHEIVKNNNGSLVKIEDEDALARSFTEFMAKESLNKESIETYNIIKQKFNWDLIIEKLNSQLEKLF